MPPQAVSSLSLIQPIHRVMNLTVFLVFCQILTLLMVSAFGAFRAHFARDPLLQVQIRMLKKNVATEQLRTQLLLEDLTEFKTYVATHLPEIIKRDGRHEKGYPVRNLASVTTSMPSSRIQEHMSNQQFLKAKSAYQTGDYDSTRELLENFIRIHPYSVHIVEAHYLLEESLFHLGREEASAQTIEKMVRQFPESELTGFAMIRLARLLEKQGKGLDAVQVYKTVLQTFPYHDVSAAAARALRSLEI